MASSRVMASSSPPQHAGAGSSADLARFKSSGVGSMNMDDIIHNIYDPEAVNTATAESAGLGPAEPSLAALEAAARRTSEERQKRMIKNRESAASSRDRKQAALEEILYQFEEKLQAEREEAARK
ncbi:hypothetical protein ZEAMMB73_Zm00001d041046 [Zea mays]|uniref:BZIP domain-containing protein n=1 Tax=Zea mays TaxID=4577 RepID=A0A1D6MTT0_MAIZE|nr:hypothetical protein ZEAMMB73_Zm00001d041046 [Zea mays]